MIEDNEPAKPKIIELEMEYFFDEPFIEPAVHVPIISATAANVRKLLAQEAARKKPGESDRPFPPPSSAAEATDPPPP